MQNNANTDRNVLLYTSLCPLSELHLSFDNFLILDLVSLAGQYFCRRLVDSVWLGNTWIREPNLVKVP